MQCFVSWIARDIVHRGSCVVGLSTHFLTGGLYKLQYRTSAEGEAGFNISRHTTVHYVVVTSIYSMRADGSLLLVEETSSFPSDGSSICRYWPSTSFECIVTNIRNVT